MVKYLLFEQEEFGYLNIDERNEVNEIIKLIYDKYTLKSEKEGNINLLINELRKDKDILEKYDSLKYDIIDDDVNGYCIVIDTITDEIYEDFDINNIIDDLINIFELDCIKDENSYNNVDIYRCTNEKIINIILSLENDVKYNILNECKFNIYYIEIQDEINKYINLLYRDPCHIRLKPNKYALLNDNSNQYIVINQNKHKQNLNYYKEHKENESKDYLILYYDYDRYFKDNYEKIITKYKDLFTIGLTDFEIIIKSLNIIKKDNNIKKYINYDIF